MDQTAKLAKSITRKASRQTYFTARHMVDKPLVNDFLRAYAYFRWVDDMIDEVLQSNEERISFIKGQRALIESLYLGQSPKNLNPNEEIIAVLINHDRKEKSKLQSFILNMFAIVEFDAYRKGRLITQQELDWYTDCLAKSVTDGLQYFIGNGHQYLVSGKQYLAAKAAHIVHLLRDMVKDIQNGFINIPIEYLELHNIDPGHIEGPAFNAWVQDRANLARSYFKDGMSYLDKLQVLRCKLVGLWYCSRFERILERIEKEDFLLKESYQEKHKPSGFMRIAWLGFVTPINHWKYSSMR